MVQAFDTVDPLPKDVTGSSIDGAQAHAIATYRDQNLRVYVFHAGGTTYQVMGRSSLERLDDAAKHLCGQVVRQLR